MTTVPRRRAALLWVALALAAVPRPAAADPPATAAVAGDADFAAAVFGRVAAAAPGNVFLSPYSLRAALAMTATGAAGRTADQMAAALRLPAGGPDATAAAFAAQAAAVSTDAGADGCELDAAAAVWAAVAAPVRPAFAARARSGFGASAETADFAADPDAARRHINGWVEDHTRRRIADLLPPGSVRAGTRLVLADAVYFKGLWADPFLPSQTTDTPFHLNASHDATVRMMSRGPAELPVYQTDAVTAVELAYRGGGASMVVVVPRAVDGLPAVERGLTGDVVRGWVDGLRPATVELSVPRFTATGTYDLVPTLRAMGMADALGSDADFSGMVDGGGVGIGGVFHKAFVAVDEQGTEAAAATGVVMRPTAMPPRIDRLVVTADRPFLYFVRDRTTGAVLFMGRCADPRS